METHFGIAKSKQGQNKKEQTMTQNKRTVLVSILCYLATY